MDLNVYVHLSDSGERVSVHALLDQILTRLRALEAQGVKILMVSQQTKDVLVRIETATTDLGVRVRAIQAKVGTGMTDAEVAEVNSELGAIAGNLEGMAKDPEQPIPPQV